jgi:hypothetical protein
MASAAATVRCMPACLSHYPTTVLQLASTTPDPTNRPRERNQRQGIRGVVEEVASSLPTSSVLIPSRGIRKFFEWLIAECRINWESATSSSAPAAVGFLDDVRLDKWLDEQIMLRWTEAGCTGRNWLAAHLLAEDVRCNIDPLARGRCEHCDCSRVAGTTGEPSSRLARCPIRRRGPGRCQGRIRPPCPEADRTTTHSASRGEQPGLLWQHVHAASAPPHRCPGR